MPPTTIRLDPDVKEGIERLAKEDERSISSFINRLLRAHIDSTQKGELEKDP
ncbi:putative transcriptional regulator [Bradyrhizobium sp. LB9.1b]